jgi:hypothetical protein
LENRRAEQVLSGGRGGTSERWEDVGKGCAHKFCVHMYLNGKMRPVETIARMGERRDKGE